MIKKSTFLTLLAYSDVTTDRVLRHCASRETPVDIASDKSRSSRSSTGISVAWRVRAPGLGAGHTPAQQINGKVRILYRTESKELWAPLLISWNSNSLWWRCRESNPGPSELKQGFYGRSAFIVFSVLNLLHTSIQRTHLRNCSLEIFATLSR